MLHCKIKKKKKRVLFVSKLVTLSSILYNIYYLQIQIEI